ncbi:ATP-dependent endonuclease [Ensifer sp. MMN_5]|nr:ATP-dependent endonuclease [Ensifer sp. MMN_5]
MYLHSYRLRNFRRLRNVHVELASDISIFVGANNSGKTSATQAMQMFLSGGKDAFSLYDFSSHVWPLLDEIGEREGEIAEAEFPTVSLDLWFEVGAEDLYLVIPILPSTAWAGTLVGVRVELAPKNIAELIQRYRTARDDGRAKAAALVGGAGNYVPWPKSLSAYLLEELRREYELRYYVLDHTQFDPKFRAVEGYQPLPLGHEPGGAAVLRSLIKVDFLNAQRHLADPSTVSGGGGRSEDLSKRLSRFYQRNLDQRQDDHQALKALFESEVGLDNHLTEVFKDTLDRLGRLGYPGINNPRLEIKSALNPASIMAQDARVHYIVGEGAHTIMLPDTYNGLGFKNLIYMVVEVLDLQERWKAEEEKRAPLHLIFIEEPEAHLHAQLQQVFIRNILDLLVIPGEAGGSFASQAVITTHSPHILYERGFQPIRYFRRDLVGNDQVTEVLNLSAFYAQETEHRDFLQRYLKLTHCDLFFSDAAVLVEGNVERLLLPIMISKAATSLRSSCICILEVGGAFGHKFKSLIEFLGIVTLIITDVDSVTLLPADHDGDDDDDDELEVEVETEAVDNQEALLGGVALPAPAGEAADPVPARRYGKKCLPGVVGAVTSNQTLVKWLPAKQSIDDLFAATEQEKETPADGTTRVRVAYQTPVPVVWNGHNAELAGRTLEEAFGLENADWCQSAEQRKLGLRLRGALADPAALAVGLHKRVSGDKFDKTKFALGVLTARPDEWQVPAYIRDGLIWLKAQVDLEVEAEMEGAGVGE